MVSSRGALVNKLLTSNEIILNLFGIFSVFNLGRKSFVFDLYIWNSHAHIQLKQGSLKNLIQRSISICSNENSREDELNCFRNVLIKVNNYPPTV